MVTRPTRPAAAPRTKPALCRLASVSVRAHEYGRTIVAGEPVDLLEVIAPGLTLEQALGRHLAGFDVIDGQENA